MAAATNGIALHGGLLPFCATFFNFLDYFKPALRLAALTKLHAIFVFTHDSVFLGEDGPTHQPIEQLAMLRATPNVRVDPSGRRARNARSLEVRDRSRTAAPVRARALASEAAVPRRPRRAVGRAPTSSPMPATARPI